MGKTYKELKKKIEQLRFENCFLTSKVEKVLLENSRVKRELQVSNSRIVELANEVEELQAKLINQDGLVFFGHIEEFTVSEKNKISPFCSSCDVDTYIELSTRANLSKREEKSFSSRFMPNVKFIIEKDVDYSILNNLIGYGDHTGSEYCAFTNGSFIVVRELSEFKKIDFPLVSCYEAIPELVPDGMKYDKESDSLVHEKVILSKNANTDSLISSMIFKKEKEIVDAPATFSSRFMPNVRINTHKDIFNNRVFEKFYVKNKDFFNNYFSSMLDYCITDTNGSTIITVSKEVYDAQSHMKEVSFFDAIPELVPDGMVYDKESDSLVKKECVNHICIGKFCVCDVFQSFKKTDAKIKFDPHKELVSLKVNYDANFISLEEYVNSLRRLIKKISSKLA